MTSRVVNKKPNTSATNPKLKLSKKNIDFIKNILDTFRFPFLVLDSELKVVTLNSSFSDTFKINPVDIKNKNVYSIASNQWDIPEFKKVVEEVNSAGQKIIKHQLEHNFTSVGKRVVSLSAQRIPASHGNSKYILIIIEDITKQKELNDINNSFLSIAAHDLRTPMTIIMGYINMLQNGDFGHIDPIIKKPLLEISTASTRMLRLINDFLTVSRVNQGKLNIVINKFDLIPIIKETIDQVKTISKNKNLKFIAKNLPISLNVLADSDKIREVIYNLLDNAVKFTNKGSITIEAIQDKQLAAVSITDTGQGIPKDLQIKLFDKFYQVKNGSGSGLGLGLYISRLIVKECRGKIWVESKENVGSKFSFSLPNSK